MSFIPASGGHASKLVDELACDLVVDPEQPWT
jgi:hypothetical protein